jgi:hypothetical protein
VTNLLDHLPAREHRGSRARVVLLTHGSNEEVAKRLTVLVAPQATIHSPHHLWRPRVGALGETQLGKTSEFLSPEQREAVCGWWLAVRHPAARLPTWDLVSHATIEGREGLVLFEAKAHDAELIAEEPGKRCDSNASQNSVRNHVRIADCIAQAARALSTATGLEWKLSHDHCYQMANRFAWAWKLASLGIPVVLVYLGFLNSDEMRDRGRPFAQHKDWEDLVRSHSGAVCPEATWGTRLEVQGTPLIPLIQSAEVSLDPPVPAAVAEVLSRMQAELVNSQVGYNHS